MANNKSKIKNQKSKIEENEKPARNASASVADGSEELENLENSLKRALADYQNLEKRVGEEKSEWIKMANRDLLFKLLPVFDTLNLAQKHIQDEGLILSIKQFMDVLRSVGVEKINTQDQTFDPSSMEAVEKTGEGEKVIDEVRAGFTLFGKVIRPVLVKVG